jgi:drug/metabolite transporter (DMT)-like permease
MVRPSPLALIFIATTIVFTVVGQLLVKRGMLEVGAVPSQSGDVVAFLIRAFTNPMVILGLASAVVAAVSWTAAVSRSPLSFAYPFMALAIVLVLALSGLLFSESVAPGRWLGVGIVCLGLIVAAVS